MATLEVKDQEELTQATEADKEQTTTDPLSKSMTLIQTVEVDRFCHSVYHHEGNTYVGTGGGVDKIDNNYQLSKSFLQSNGSVLSVAVYKDRLYTLTEEFPNPKVSVHELTGQRITSWASADDQGFSVNKHAIIEDQVVIPEKRSRSLSVYSLTGEVIKRIPCSLFHSYTVTMCAAKGQSVILCDSNTSQVAKISIYDGEILWISGNVPSPNAVTCHKNKIFVSSYGPQVRVYILDEMTGELLAVMTDPEERRNMSIVDLHISGQMLIAAAFSAQQVFFYQLD